jgi:hypothetical protein
VTPTDVTKRIVDKYVLQAPGPSMDVCLQCYLVECKGMHCTKQVITNAILCHLTCSYPATARKSILLVVEWRSTSESEADTSCVNTYVIVTSTKKRQE